jgi:hypothetical protein
MTDILFDQPYNKDERDVFVPRLKHFYFVIPSFNSDEETVLEEIGMFKALQAEMPQWGVIHIITRDAMFGASQPVYIEEYVVNYFSMDPDGFRIPIVTGFSEFSFADITYAEVSA